MSEFEHIDYKGNEIYAVAVSCAMCGKDLGYFNQDWVDGSIMGICIECHNKLCNQ